MIRFDAPSAPATAPPQTGIAHQATVPGNWRRSSLERVPWQAGNRPPLWHTWPMSGPDLPVRAADMVSCRLAVSSNE